jgi:hypothetical protein
VAVSDPQSRPRDGDRKRAVEEIDSAYAEGRITAADRALRVGNVESAATLGELDLVVRDLKLDPGEVAPRMVPPLPAPPAPPAPPPPPPTAAGPSGAQPTVSVGGTFPPPSPQGQAYGIERVPGGQGFRVTAPRSPGTGFRLGCLLLVGLIVLVTAGAGVLVARSDFGPSIDVSDDPFPFPEDPAGPIDEPTGAITQAPVDRLAFTVAGLRWFIGRYEDEFGTTRTLRLTLWADRASVDRPVHGGRRHEMWDYRDGRFEKFGPITTNSPGTTVVDLRQLALKALVGNIARAKRTLGVEKPDTVYVILASDTLGEGPEAHIYVTNKYHESGYLATTFGGRVVRSFPYQR